MRKRVLKFMSCVSAAVLLGAGFTHPVLGQEVTKSGVVVEPINNHQAMQNEKTPLLSDEVLVIKYKTPLSQSELQKAGLVMIKHIPSLNTAVVKLKNKKNMNSVIRTFSKKEHIASIQPSALYKPFGNGDPKASQQYYMQMLNIPKAQSMAGKNKVRVAVIDQGIDMNHPELKDKLLPSYNAVNPMSAGKPDFHGTHVAGILGSSKGNGIGGYGVNPNVEILPIDVFDRGYGAPDYAIAQGILYAIEKDAKVINLSLGGPFPSQIVDDAVKKAIDKGIVIVAAAGNSGDDAPNYPAAYEGVISVGNIDEKKKLAVDSSFGASVDVVAPGENIYNAIYEYEKKSSFRHMSGTSMASPVVAGVASLLLSKNPSLTPAEIEYILKHTSDDLGAKGFDVKFGYGLINPVKALSYDQKRIPSYIKNGKFEREKAIEKAATIEVNGEKVLTGNMTIPQQEKWLKVQVKAGQTLQLQLQGSEPFDYKLMGKWLNSKKEEFEINEVGHGLAEGVVLNIKEDGILAIGVKDVHGQYDDSESKQSNYKLKVTLTGEVPVDNSDISKPMAIQSLPAKVEEQTLYAPSGEVDEDFYSFKVAEPQTVKVAIDGLPGVDSSISVYSKEMMDLFVTEDGTVDPELMEPLKYENRKGKSEGEAMLFTAEADVEYIVKVSNKPELVFGFFEFLMDPSLINNEPKPMSSLDMYDITFEGYVLPEDEDGYSMYGMDMEEESGLIVEKNMVEQLFSIVDEQQSHTEMIKEIAIPITSEPTKGYLQMEGDQDWYQITAEADGLYKLDLKKGGLKPLIEVSHIVKDSFLSEEEMETLLPIGDNTSERWDGNLKDEIYLSFEKGKTYYIKAEANYMNDSGNSIDPYEFQLKKIADIKKDPYEPNDKHEEAKTMKTPKVTSTFGKANDMDIYYLQTKKPGLYGVSITPSELTKQLKATYPESVLQPANSFGIIHEDVNKNKKLDKSEMERGMLISSGVNAGKTFGSFEAKKNANYFITVSGSFMSNPSFSLRPYELTVKPIVNKDLDSKNTGVSLQKVKPEKMKLKRANVYSSQGYFNPEAGYGDEDWYSFTMNKSGKATITLRVPKEIDGQIEIYQNKKLVKAADYYPEGDHEVVILNLDKGEYWIKVKEAYNQASIDPYQLIVNAE